MSVSFQLIALASIGAICVLYILKWLQQKTAGQKADQLSAETLRNTGSALHFITSASVIITIATQLASIFLADYLGRPLPVPAWANNIIRGLGAVLAVLAVLVFWLSVRAMKKNWRVGIDNTGEARLVTKGIYGLSRNPAYLAFDLLFIGILLMYYNPVLLISSAFSALMLHIQIMQEERWLKKTFGQPYIDYKERVRRYFGKRAD